MPAAARLLLFCALLTASASSLGMTVFTTTDTFGVMSYSYRPSPGARAAVLGDPGLAPFPHAYRYPFPWRGGPFRLSQGPNGRFSHTGPKGRYAMDIAMPEGTPIVAAREGEVVEVENRQWGRRGNPAGNFIRIRHPDGTYGGYMHLQRGSVLVRKGQRVARGQPLAKSGNTGNSSGPHLHFVVQRSAGDDYVSIPYQFDRPLGGLPDFTAGNP